MIHKQKHSLLLRIAKNDLDMGRNAVHHASKTSPVRCHRLSPSSSTPNPTLSAPHPIFHCAMSDAAKIISKFIIFSHINLPFFKRMQFYFIIISNYGSLHICNPLGSL